MTNNQVKQYLMRYRHIQKSIKIKEDKIRQLQAQALDITSSISQDVVQTSNLSGGFADFITKAMDIQTQIQAEMYVQHKILAEIDLRLHNMSKCYPQLANVLYLYYLNGLTWEQVCVEMGCSWMHVVGRLHPQALDIFKNFM